MPIGDAAEKLLHRHILDRERAAAPFEAREIQEIPDQRLELLGLVSDDPEIAAARRRVEAELRHRQRLGVAAHGGERRHELVRHVGEQLPSRAIRGGQCGRAGAEIVGHPVEGVRERADLVAPASTARTSVRPSPSARAACSSVRSRRCAGLKISSAALAAPIASSTRPTQVSVGPSSRIATKTGGGLIGMTTNPIGVLPASGAAAPMTMGAAAEPRGGLPGPSPGPPPGGPPERSRGLPRAGSRGLPRAGSRARRVAVRARRAGSAGRGLATCRIRARARRVHRPSDRRT